MAKIDFRSKYEYYNRLAKQYLKDNLNGLACGAYINAARSNVQSAKKEKVLYSLAYCLKRENNFEFAKEALFKVLRINYRNIRAMMMLIELEYKQNHFDIVRYYLDLLHNMLYSAFAHNDITGPIGIDDKLDAEVFYELGKATNGEFPFVFKSPDRIYPINNKLGALVTTADERAKDELSYAMHVFEHGQDQMALDFIDKTLSNKKISEEVKGELYNTKAYIYYQIDKIQESFECLQKASYYNKKDIKTLALYVAFAEYSKNEALRDETLKDMCEVETDDLEDIKIIIETLCRNNKFDSANEFINRKLEKYPDCYEYNKLKGIIFFNSKDIDNAKIIFNKLYVKYGVETDIKFYIYAIENFSKYDELYIDCTCDQVVYSMVGKMQEVLLKAFANYKAKGTWNKHKQIRFAIEYFLRQSGYYKQVEQITCLYLLENKDFLKDIVENASRYNSDYLINISGIDINDSLGIYYQYTGNNIYSNNFLVKIEKMINGISPSCEQAFYYTCALSINLPTEPQNLIDTFNKILKVMHTLAFVNKDFLKQELEDVEMFTNFLYILAFQEQYELILADFKEKNKYIAELYEKFDIINYRKNFNLARSYSK